MPFWSGDTIEARLSGLITPFDVDDIDCAAYTLHIGGEVYVSPSEAESKPHETTVRKLQNTDAFTIPPGQFAFLLTEEEVSIPKNILALISMKSSVKFRGLVNISGFHVDPGYSGKLVFSVFNAGPQTIHLKRGDDCFLIWFADLDLESKKHFKSSQGFDSIKTNIVSGISGRLISLEGLNSRLEKIEQTQNLLWVIGLGIFLALLPVGINAWEKWLQ